MEMTIKESVEKIFWLTPPFDGKVIVTLGTPDGKYGISISDLLDEDDAIACKEKCVEIVSAVIAVAVEEARREEREACAKVAEEVGYVKILLDSKSGYERGMNQTALDIAAAIRAREP